MSLLHWLGIVSIDKLKEQRDIIGLAKCQKSSNWFTRKEATEALGDIGGEKAVHFLLQAMKDSDLNVRYEAVRSLGKIRCATAVEPLVAALDDPNWLDDRSILIQTLEKIGDARAADSIYRIAHDVRYTTAWYSAYYALASFGDSRALEGLSCLLDAVHDGSLSAECLVSFLSKMGEKAVNAIIRYLRKDAPLHVNLKSWVEPTYLGVIHPLPSHMTETVAIILGMLKSKNAVEPLLELDWRCKSVADAAAWALGQIGERDERVIRRLEYACEIFPSYPQVFKEALSKLRAKKE